MKPISCSAGSIRLAGLLLGAFLLFVSCGDPAEPPVDPDPPADMAAYLATLPTWDVFSPRLEDKDPEPVGDPVELPPDTLDVQSIKGDGTVETLRNQVYVCTETPYSMTQNPREIVMYSPNVGILWAGGLLQGKSHKAGNLESLPIRQRQPVKVSIPAIASGVNYRVVENPDLATVNAAIMDMVGSATLAGTPSSSSIDFEYTESYSEQQLALAMGLSGRYMGFRAKANASFEHNAAETTVTAHFVEKMFDVVVELPQTPADFFSPEFTQEELDQQTALGRMGPDNLPVFIHTITYGRMMTFTMTSTASVTEIHAAMEAAYRDIGRSGELNLEAKHKAILENARISVTSYGGNAQATLDVIRTGDWSQYFTKEAPLSTATPLSYVFQTLDGKPAGVTEATDYTMRECRLQLPTDGIFDFTSLQTVPLGVSTSGLRTLFADVNGDGRTDIIWNSVSGTTNAWTVGLSNGDGTFTMTDPMTHPVAAPAVAWSYFDTVVGDFDGDDLADLAWATTGPHGFNIYVATSVGDGTFDVRGPVKKGYDKHAHSLWRVYAGDTNRDGIDDLFFNRLSTENNYTYVATSSGTGDFAIGPFNNRHITGRWDLFDTFIGDANADGKADLLWARAGRSVGQPVRAYFGFSGTNGNLGFSPAYTVPFYSDRTVVVAGDVNGDGRTDLVWAWNGTAAADSANLVIVGLVDESSVIRWNIEGQARIRNSSPLALRAGDLNGDGRADLLWNELGADNRVYVSLGKSDGTFDFSTPTQLHTEERTDWTQYAAHLADFNGDGRQDVIWIHAMDQTRIYVGLAR